MPFKFVHFLPKRLSLSYAVGSNPQHRTRHAGFHRLVRSIAFIVTALGCLGGCSFPGVYKIDVQQGTIVEKEAAETLEVGMTREQVHYLLGSPLLEPLFTDSYENYVYTIQLSGGKIRQQHIRLEFDGDALSRIAKLDLLPAEFANPGEVYKVRGLREAETLVEESGVQQPGGVERRQQPMTPPSHR